MHFKTTNVSNGGAATVKGLMVYSVVPGSAAERAGLKPGDLVETIDGHPSFELPQHPSREPRAEATLGVLRGGERLSVKLRRPKS
ncbi:MAG: PDZ domain-containing protein [Acidobacteria bacterium]|nr:PDZ domain-containing protein [Acidobacteriota bacterium]